MDYREPEWSRPPPRDLQNSPSEFHFSLGMRMGETVTHLQALREEVRELPEQIALHLGAELRHWGMAPTETPKSGFVAALKHWMKFLESGLPYVQLAKRMAIATILLATAVIGNYNPALAKSLAEKAIGLILGQ